MARWILERPDEHANPAELRVAERLRTLRDDWIVRWGYHYKQGRNVREGDFLVLGPSGGLLVIEVKGGQLRHLPEKGIWMAGDRQLNDSPVEQLMNQWGGVRKHLGKMALKNGVNANSLWVDKVLALPDVRTGGGDHMGIDRSLILDADDLGCFDLWWQQRFKPDAVSDEARECFLDTFGRTARPFAIRHFVDHSEAVFRRQCLANFTMLDMLRDNRQLVVVGGAGTGKTWHAVVQAVRLASAGGRRVLLLCYNLALAAEIRGVLAGWAATGKGRIDVMAWEELARSLIEEAGLAWNPPAAGATKEVAAGFYDEQLPALMLQAVERLEPAGALPRWDALVVDEAQDHDTGGTADWWAIYLRLLKQGRHSRMALFLDPAQRPEFRRGEFDLEQLIASLDHPVRVRLPRPLRYTRPVAEYVKSLRGEAVDRLVAGMGPVDELPPGPDVVSTVVADRRAALEQVARIIGQWCRDGYCRPWDLLLVHRRRTLRGSCLEGVEELAGARLVPYDEAPPKESGDMVLRHVSANRAKGLDALGVVVIDFEPFDAGNSNGWHGAYFMACSRARQLLAIVCHVERKNHEAGGG